MKDQLAIAEAKIAYLEADRAYLKDQLDQQIAETARCERTTDRVLIGVMIVILIYGFLVLTVA